jgi:hypothetical protein
MSKSAFVECEPFVISTGSTTNRDDSYANFIDDRSDSMRVPPSGGGIGQRVTLA